MNNLNQEKFVYVCLFSSIISLDSIIEQVKFIYNNVLFNTLMSMRLNLSIHNIKYLHVYIYKNILC